VGTVTVSVGFEPHGHVTEVTYGAGYRVEVTVNVQYLRLQSVLEVTTTGKWQGVRHAR
jgi:hypothetical protein